MFMYIYIHMYTDTYSAMYYDSDKRLCFKLSQLI